MLVEAARARAGRFVAALFLWWSWIPLAPAADAPDTSRDSRRSVPFYGSTASGPRGSTRGSSSNSGASSRHGSHSAPPSDLAASTEEPLLDGPSTAARVVHVGNPETVMEQVVMDEEGETQQEEA